LLLPEGVLRESWDIVCYADRHGAATPLIPADRTADVHAYRDLADRTMTAARPLVLMGLLASPEALDETFPAGVPSWLRRLLRPVAANGTRWFARKYGIRLDDEHTPLAALHATLLTLRQRLAGAPYLLGTFSYADILMAGLLQGVAPVADEFIPLGPATHDVWSRPELAAEFSDLVAWRDALYTRHRRPAQPPAARVAPARA
jgi:glutathione S-transferase